MDHQVSAVDLADLIQQRDAAQSFVVTQLVRDIPVGSGLGLHDSKAAPRRCWREQLSAGWRHAGSQAGALALL